MKTCSEFLEELKAFFNANNDIITVFNTYPHGRVDICREALFLIEKFQAEQNQHKQENN